MRSFDQCRNFGVRILVAIGLFAFSGSAQQLVLPKEWRGLNPPTLLQRPDFRLYPFSIQRLALEAADSKFRTVSEINQMKFLAGVEKDLAEAQHREKRLFLIWNSDDTEYCNHILIQGAYFQLVRVGPFFMAVTFRTDGDFAIVDIYTDLDQSADSRIDIDPRRFRLYHVDPKLEQVTSINPAQIAGKIQSRARWGANFTRAIGSMQTTTVTANTRSSGSGDFTVRDLFGYNQVTGTYSGSGTSSTTITTPDYEARARAEQAAREREERALQRADSLLAGALVPHTLFPGKRHQGSVYFKKPKKTAFSILTIPVNKIEMEFGVKWK